MNICRRGSIRVIALFVIVAVLATACSSDSDSGDSATPSTEAEGSVNREGTLRWGYGLQHNGNFTLDPTQLSSGTSMDPLWYLLYARLMRKLPDGTLTPDLAESAEVVNANLIEVKVRPDLTWTDGSVFDANSVKVGLDRNLASNNSSNFNAGFFEGNPTVSVVDDQTVQINLPAGNALSWFDSYIAGVQTSILKDNPDPNNPIGAGPMRVAQFSPGTSMTLERNEDYWNADAVNFKQIQIVPNEQNAPQAALAALQSGQSDVATLPTEQLIALSGDLEQVAVSDPNRMMRFVTCKRDAPLDNVDIRRALSQAIDRQAISDAVFAGTAEPATQFWPEGNRFYNTEVGDELGYDPESARQLVQDSGIANPEFDFYLLNAFSIPTVAEVLKQQFAEVGITANLKVTANFPAEFLEPKLPGGTIIPQTPAPGALRLQTVSGGGLGNLCNYENAEIDRLAGELSKVSVESEEAQQIWWELDAELAESVPMAPMLFIALTGGYNSSKLVLEETYPDGGWVLPDIYTSYMAE